MTNKKRIRQIKIELSKELETRLNVAAAQLDIPRQRLIGLIIEKWLDSSISYQALPHIGKEAE